MKHPAPDQSEIVAFLSNPASYSPVPATVERMDTHGAMVFLAGDQAIKIKKPVAFSYMDFSTPEKRRKAILREFEINQPHAPGLYRRVVPITRNPSGELAFDGAGPPVEWALVMRRFRQDQLLSAMADAGRLSADIMAALARLVAKTHQGARVHFDAAPLDALMQRVEQNAKACRAFPELFDDERTARLFLRLHDVLGTESGHIRRRLERGYMRRCHGDLHLRNIVLLKGKPVLFDAIEFDENIATIDILDDLAFLLMDLIERGFTPLANQVLNVWLNAMNEIAQYEALCLLPLYLASRAGIRTKVMLALMRQLEGDKARAVIRDAVSYFCASEALIRPSKPVLIVTAGLSGSGKTTLARRIAPYIGAAPGAVHLRSDVIRKSLMGVDETVRLPESAYTKAVTAKVYSEIHRRAKAALEAGHSVIADAVYAHETERGEIENIARQSGAVFHGLWLEAAPETLKSRIAVRRGDASDADAKVLARQLEYEIGKLNWQKIDAAEKSETLARRILERVIGIEPTTFSLGS